jgi:guanine deaminase
MSDSAVLLRAAIFHTPRNPFDEPHALEAFPDGALIIRDARITACGEYASLRASYADVPVRDLRGGYLLPGFIDTHVHFPQLRILGGLGHELLDWLESVALPEEAHMADAGYASETAQRFIRALASHGTTTALVFGSHFKPATAALFDAAQRSGLRLVSGLVLSDRLLRPDLLTSPEQAYRDCTGLIRAYHGHSRSLFAVTPRFALSTSEAMLEVCHTLVNEHDGVRVQTHINENLREIQEVARMFPWARDYLAVYERFGLSRAGAVMAHNVHPSDSELERLAASATAISHCPWSNALLGSGLFPMRRHVEAGVRFALGTDVGGGSGFGIAKEALQAYALQRLAPGGLLLAPVCLLYLATRAGAEALQLEGETGDLAPGKSADFVYLRPPRETPLEAALERAETPEQALSILITLAGSESVAEVQVAGVPVYRAA